MTEVARRDEERCQRNARVAETRVARVREGRLWRGLERCLGSVRESGGGSVRAAGPRRNRQSGFTMIELLVVMVILGMLAALVAPNFFQNVGKARSKTARVQIANLSTALDALALDTGQYPSSSEGLQALLDAPSNMDMWDGPYIKKLPKDPWGNEYEYSGPEGGRGDYEIVSFGADGRAGGDGDAADVTNMD